ncbi:hypothetical protein MMC18_006647 [Xylographa bjoerkii]|nr:hypothetical protein [Xylographa bjoerkii]
MLEAWLQQKQSDGSLFIHRLQFGDKRNCKRYSIIPSTTGKLQVVEGSEPGSYATLRMVSSSQWSYLASDDYVDIHASAIFLEALKKGLKIIGFPLNCDSQGLDNEDDEISIWPSDNSSTSRIQLRTGDTVVVCNVRFSLKLCRQALRHEASNIIDLGSEIGSEHSTIAGDALPIYMNHLSDNRDSKARDLFTPVDSALMSAKVKSEETEMEAQRTGVDDVTEDLQSNVIVSERTLPDRIHSKTHELQPFYYDRQSSTLGVQREAVSIFGHIRRDSHYDDSKTGQYITTETNDSNYLHDPGRHVPVIQKPTISSFKDIAQGQPEEDTQDSTSLRVDDLLERAGLQHDMASSPSREYRNEAAEELADSEEHTIIRISDGATSYTEQLNETSTNTSPPLQHSNPVNNMTTHDYEQKQQHSKGPLGPDLKTSDVLNDETALVEFERTTHDDSQESSESTIVVQPRPIKEQSSLHGKTTSKVSFASNTKLPASSSSSGVTRRSYGSGSGVDGAVGIDSIKVLFGSSTSVDTIPSVMKILRSLGVRKVDTVKDCDYLCVGSELLKTTMSLVTAVASGKLVVSDKWALSSAKAKALLDPHDFMAKDRLLEVKLGISLTEAIERGSARLKPFEGYKIFFTSVIRKGLGKAFGDLKGIATHGGATVEFRFPATKEQPHSIIISSSDDPQLTKLTMDGWRCFSKDIITMTALRSALDLESDEFVLGGENSAAEVKGKVRGVKRKR